MTNQASTDKRRQKAEHQRLLAAWAYHKACIKELAILLGRRDPFAASTNSQYRKPVDVSDQTK